MKYAAMQYVRYILYGMAVILIIAVPQPIAAFRKYNGDAGGNPNLPLYRQRLK